MRVTLLRGRLFVFLSRLHNIEYRECGNIMYGVQYVDKLILGIAKRSTK